MKTCLYCQCTPNNACIVRTNDQPPAIRNQIRSYYLRLKKPMPRWIGCSWHSTNPDVCSAPRCMAKHAEASR